MQRYLYRAKDLHNKYHNGLVEARDKKEAANLLKERNFYIISLREEGQDPLKSLASIISRVSFNDVVNFTRQLATMVTAGLTLSESLSILKNQIKNPAMTRVVIQIEEDVQGGKSFAASADKFPKVFAPVYRSLIRAGEASGKLDDVLNRLADTMEKSRDFKAKTKGAFVYPVIVVIGMAIVIFIMMTLVIPKLTSMYQDFGVELPLPTRVLIATSNFFVNRWYVIIGGTVGGVFLFLKWKKTPSGSRLWDKMLLSIPVFGNLMKETTLVEVTRTLSILIGAGIPILEAIEISEGAVNNIWYKEALKDVETKVEKGFPLGQPFGDNPIFPPILGQMVSVGEQTGKLDDALFKLSRYFEGESEVAVKALTTLMEPLIMVVLGVGVGFLVLAVLLPIYSLTSQF